MLITKIEAREACDWLRAAGFPQYAQLFKDCHLPIDIDLVKSDHEFLDKDSIDSLCRRLSTLNKSLEMKLELNRSKRRGEDKDDEEPCAISPKWTFERKSRRWIRTDDMDLLHSPESPASDLRRSGSQETSLSDGGEQHDVCSMHSSSSADSDDGVGGAQKAFEDPETSRSSSRCSSTYRPLSPDTSFSGPPSPGELQSFGSEQGFHEKPPRKKGQSLLKKMEKLRLRRSTLRSPTHGLKSQLVISGPVLQQGLAEDRLKQLHCVEVSELHDKAGSPASSTPPSGSSSSQSESSSTVSTPSPVTRVRSNCKRTGSHHRSNCRDRINEQELNNQRNCHDDTVFELPHRYKPGTFPTRLSHNNSPLSPIDNTSVNWRTGSFHGYRGRRSRSSASQDHELPSSPLAGFDHRASIYDNVPEHLAEPTLEIIDDDVFSALDNVMERINGLQQLVTTWAEKLSEDGDSDFSHSSSPSPSSLTDIHLEVNEPEETDRTTVEGNYVNRQGEIASAQADRTTPERPARAQQLHWSSEQTLLTDGPGLGVEVQLASSVSLLQRLSLLKLTALMDKHSPFSKQGWNWTVPKLFRKVKASERSRRVFGVPLLLSVRQSGKPLPSGILRAMQYLKTECLDQVGLFRKSGVKSRIQCLRDMVEADPEGVSFEGQSAFDVADMIKQYFRDLPEPIFTSRLCETFLHIYQYFPKDQQFTGAQAAIFLLPDENREALHSLLLFLREVVACVEENQMTPTNIAVCLAPSLFHLNTLRRDSSNTRSSHRKYSLGRPDQRDLSENLAATQGLAHMVTEAAHLFQMPKYWTLQNPEGGSEDSPQYEGGLTCPLRSGEREREERIRLDQMTQRFLREAKEKSKGWVNLSGSEHVDLAFRKVEDGNPLREWRGIVEVDAPPQEVLHCLLREQELWQRDLRRCGVVEALDKETEIYRYVLQAAGARPPLDLLLLRAWQSDPAAGPLYVASCSTECADVRREGVRAQVLFCLFLVESLGVKRSKVTHICRMDTRGRSPGWYGRVGVHLLASDLEALRDCLKHKAKDPRA
ncbi:rho GTPase-activating protein 7 [Chanos chanos]|uniref:Rho GTPase-activating protein 7 n=1 Tax=Chanos chanos TaxID=29144 RepID=A0A6J2WYS6_CHACN|nr:rho GTPase-activating protein 7-like [Chanos chanos]